MSGAIYLAVRYLAAHRWKTLLLVAAIALIVFVPSGLQVLVAGGERELMARADATPLLVGRKGSPTELVLNSLYFGHDVPATMGFDQVARIEESGYARAIPVSVRFRSRDAPIVGTSLAYFDFRGLRVARGTMMGRLGDCVVGAAVAERRGVAPLDHVVSSPDNVFDPAGVYPLRMRVTGVLAPTGGPDDDAVFCDVKTAWVIEGLAHGHEDLARPEAAGGVLERDDDAITANASVVQYREITPENLGRFHFHGDPADFPITAVIAVPRDAKAATLLLGRYADPAGAHQILRPSAVVRDLLDTVLTVRSFVVAALALVGAATLVTAALVFALSIRVRRREIATMARIGASRARIATVLAAEIAAVLLAGLLVAAALTWATARAGADALRAILG